MEMAAAAEAEMAVASMVAAAKEGAGNKVEHEATLMAAAPMAESEEAVHTVPSHQQTAGCDPCIPRRPPRRRPPCTIP